MCFIGLSHRNMGKGLLRQLHHQSPPQCSSSSAEVGTYSTLHSPQTAYQVGKCPSQLAQLICPSSPAALLVSTLSRQPGWSQLLLCSLGFLKVTFGSVYCLLW